MRGEAPADERADASEQQNSMKSRTSIGFSLAAGNRFGQGHLIE